MYKLVIKQCADSFVFAVFAASDYAIVKFVKVSRRCRVRVYIYIYNKTRNSLISKFRCSVYLRSTLTQGFTRLVLTAIATKTQKPE